MDKDKEFLLRVKRIYEESLMQLRGIGICPAGPVERVSINYRARKRLGCCKRTGTGLAPRYQIEISHLCRGLEGRQLKEIIIHELLHTCRGSMNHGIRWKENAARVKKELGYDISSTANFEKLGISDAVAGNFRYSITCMNCGSVMYRLKKSKVVLHPESYRCSRCGGMLEVKKL
jgi:predicted SprT family Zn-dependent metalloprotease